MAAPEAPKKIRYTTQQRTNLLVRTHGQDVPLFEDVYHRVLAMPWWRFFAYVSATWVGINLVFALLYASVPGCVSGAAPGSLEDAFYFSVQTFATIGYGAMAPATRFGHGVPHLVFRLANWRGNMVVEGQLHVSLLKRVATREGDVIRVPVELPLVRNRTAMFALTWVPMHRIDESSPLWGGLEARDRLLEEGAEIFLSFSGMDETLGQSIQARYRYRLDDLEYNARFADVLTIEPDGTRVIDYARFHDIETLGQPEELVWEGAAAAAAATPATP
jgi:inward rectifier potassium channel